MAGVKVTDLTTLGTAASDDVLYIVDTSSNTSKQIEVQNIYDGMPQLNSGVFAPTISNETPSSTTIGGVSDMHWSKVGNTVTCSFRFIVGYDVADTSVVFNFDLPVPSSFNSNQNLIGTLSLEDSSNYTGSAIAANDSLDLGQIQIDGVAGSVLNASVTFQYLII